MEIERVKRQISPGPTMQEVAGHETSPKLDHYLDPYLAIEADPDLMLEIDFILASQARTTSASSKQTISDSWKSTDRIRTPVKTRGRPIKPHENEPFLSVDALSLDRLQDSSAGSALSTQSYQKGPSPSVTGTRVGSGHRSPYSCSPTLPPRKVARKAVSAPIRHSAHKREQSSKSSKNAGRYTPGSTSIYMSPNKSQKKVNHHIRSPFKHAVNRPSMTPEDTNTPPTTPAQELKERTAIATYHMGKIMSRERLERNKTPTGKLLKGKLKPLKPVVVEGPTINQCRGIVSDIRSYTASPSRTLSRRRQLLQNIPNVHEYLYERPQTVESIHRTSAASSVDENRDNVIKEDYIDPETDRTDKASYAGTEETIPYVPPGSRATASPATQLDSHRKDVTSRTTDDGDPRMFMTEIGAKNNKSELEQDIAGNMNEKLKIDDVKNGTNNSIYFNGEDPRPHTAITDGRHITPTSSRPHTAGDVTGKTKSVRFADDSKAVVTESAKSKAVKEIRNAQIIEEQKRETLKSYSDEKKTENVVTEGDEEQKSISKVSCRPNDLEQIDQKKDDGKDKDPSPGGAGVSGSGAHTVSGANVNNSDSAALNTTNKTSSSESNTTEKNGKQNTFKSTENISDLQVMGIVCPQTPTPRSRSPSPQRAITRAKSPSTSATCDRMSRSKGQTPSLQVQSVVHGDGVHTVVGPESPSHRSRSPSPVHSIRSGNPQRSKKQQDKSTKICKPNKTSKLVRPSSANLSGRDKKRYSKSSFTKSLLSEKSTSEECLESKKSKVYFEGENPPHSSIFLENNDGDNVKLKENTVITFEDIEAELNAIKDNIIEKRQFEDAVEVDIESYSDSNDSSNVKFDGDIFEEIETISSEYIERETWRDYTDLLDVYRKKCMEVSEKCGELSELLTSPRKLFRDRPKSANSGQSSSVGKRRSSTSGIGCSSSAFQETMPSSSVHYFNDKRQMLTRTVSDTTISDSGCSMGNHSDSTLKNEEQDNRFTMNSFSLNHVTDRTSNYVTEKGHGKDVGSDKMIDLSDKVLHGNGTSDNSSADDRDENGIGVDDKPLLAMVCDELSEVDKSNEEVKQRTNGESSKDPLKVVATAKKMSKPKLTKNQRNKGPIAPFAPVCFEISARPPAGYMYYFAYGTDMNPVRLSTYIKRDVKRFWGLLFGFQMVFNKKGADVEAGGFANIEFNPFFSTEGSIYTITSQELELLDKHVGYPEHYEHLVLPVWLMNSSDPDVYSVAQYCVPAVTYIAQEKWIASEGEHLNCDYTLSQCVKSSDLLTKPYRDHMISLNSPMREQVASA